MCDRLAADKIVAKELRSLGLLSAGARLLLLLSDFTATAAETLQTGSFVQNRLQSRLMV